MPTLPEQMASQAEFIVNNHTETHYTHDVDINVDTGVYDCDCSEYVGFVLKGVASMHYRLVEASVPYPRPLAADYYLFFVKPDLPSTRLEQNPCSERRAPGRHRRMATGGQLW